MDDGIGSSMSERWQRHSQELVEEDSSRAAPAAAAAAFAGVASTGGGLGLPAIRVMHALCV